MEIFISLTKYNTRQRSEEGKQLQVVYYLISILTHLIIVSNVFMKNGSYPLLFIGRVYNSNVAFSDLFLISIMNTFHIHEKRK